MGKTTRNKNSLKTSVFSRKNRSEPNKEGISFYYFYGMIFLTIGIGAELTRFLPQVPEITYIAVGLFIFLLGIVKGAILR